MLRYLRIAVTALSLKACVLLVVLWVRSYHTAERMHGWLWGERMFVLASKQGRVTVLPFRPEFAPGFWKWEVRQYSVDHNWSFPSGDMRRYESAMGFGLIRRPEYLIEQLFYRRIVAVSDDSASAIPFVDDPPSSYPQHMVSYSNFTHFDGTGVIVPYWFLVAVGATTAAVLHIQRPRRFSLRTLLIATTLISLALGLIIASTR